MKSWKMESCWCGLTDGYEKPKISDVSNNGDSKLTMYVMPQ